MVRAVLPCHPYARICMPTTHPFHLFRSGTRMMLSGTDSMCYLTICRHQTKLTTWIYFLHRAYTLNGNLKWLLGVGATLM